MAFEKPEWLAQMEAVLETLNEGVLIIDTATSRIVFANECFERLTAAPRAELYGRTRDAFYSGDDLAFLDQQIARSQEVGRLRYEFFIPRPALGDRVPVIISGRRIQGPDGRPFAVITFTDISEQKQAEARLKAANEALEARYKEIEFELKLAARVQQSMAPKQLRWGRVAVEWFYMPVRTIGGDFGMVVPRDEEALNLIVADISGHGISSALIANRIYTESLSLLENGSAPEDLLRRLNRFVLDQIAMPGFCFSMAVARLDQEGRRLRIAGGGHPPALYISAKGETRQLESLGLLLGCLPDAIPAGATQELELQPGDRLALYTDGFTEVFNERGETLDVSGLEAIVRGAAREPLAQMKQAVLNGVEAWRQGPLKDDMSLMLVEFA